MIVATPHGWAGELVENPQPGAEVTLPGELIADVERLGDLDGLILWRRRSGSSHPEAPAGIHLELLSSSPRVVLPDRTVELSPRHAEILATLMLAGRGMTSRELTAAVYGSAGKNVTLRAEMSRLRRLLGGMLRTRPYAFAVPVSSDLEEAEEHLAAGRIGEAAALCREGVLPGSQARALVEARARLQPALGPAAPAR